MKSLALVFIGLSLLLSSCAVNLHSSIKLRKTHKGEVFDAVIVPGFPYYENTDNFILKMRILWAKKLYDMGKTKHIVFTGSAVSTKYNEALVMKQIAMSLGVPESVIYTEKKAEHSTENIYFAMQICEQQNFSKIALATDFMQTAFLKSYTDRFFPYIGKLPIHFDQINMKTDISQVDVKDCQIENFVSIKERKTKEQIAYSSKGNNIDTSGYYMMNARFTASLNP